MKATAAFSEGPVDANLRGLVESIPEAARRPVSRSPSLTWKNVPIAKSALALMNEVHPPIRWAVHELIPEGTILLAGKPKSGKSWLLLNLMISTTLQLRLLKREVTHCDGLYLALEDNDRRMHRRFDTLLRDYLDLVPRLAGLEYRCDWPPGAAGAAMLDEYLTAHPKCKIVGVDTLKMIRGQQDCRRDSYSLDYESILPWKAVAEKHGVTLIIVHHTRKAEADDVFDEISGTLGLTGAVDQLMVLRRLPSNPKQATLHTRGRDLPEDVELGIELKDGWWELLGSAQELASNDARRVVLEVLRDEPGGMTVTELLKATGKKSRPSLTKLLKRMADDGLVLKQGTKYIHPPL